MFLAAAPTQLLLSKPNTKCKLRARVMKWLLQCRASSLHDKIMEQQEELAIQSRMRQELAAEEQASRAFEATLSESEESDTPEAEPPATTAEPGTESAMDAEVASISAEELEQNRQEFFDLMRVNAPFLLPNKQTALLYFHPQHLMHTETCTACMSNR